jgi:hypothetical protein
MPGEGELLLIRIMAAQLQVSEAESELAELGITTPSPADVVAWINASPKQRESLAVSWAVLQTTREPEWKSR